ncbi:MAG: GNAT family N-acetyltransferase [Bryobacterales bacterium]|nr:GNAT family N-acetyltransferase [Bryobacterales bacterium]
MALLEQIARERIHTAIDQPWPAAEQRRYIEQQSPRECIHLAETGEGELLGYQVLEQYAASISSMAHVGQLGTYVRTGLRGQGIGRRLFEATLGFALSRGYRKFVIQVRATNAAALAYYQSLGFTVCGRYTRHVLIDGVEEDEVLLELHLAQLPLPSTSA